MKEKSISGTEVEESEIVPVRENGGSNPWKPGTRASKKGI
jgi:hypothetical protein